MDNEVDEKKNRLTELLSKYCEEILNEEYKTLCLKLLNKMSRKRTPPYLSGKIEIWASAIVYAIGQINFLFDKSFIPYQTADEICNYFKTSKSTTSQKAKIIKDMFSLNYYDKDFSTKKMIDSNPFDQYVMIDGLIVPKDMIKK